MDEIAQQKNRPQKECLQVPSKSRNTPRTRSSQGRPSHKSELTTITPLRPLMTRDLRSILLSNSQEQSDRTDGSPSAEGKAAPRPETTSERITRIFQASVWKGFISFGRVFHFRSAFFSRRRKAIHFHMLRRKILSRVTNSVRRQKAKPIGQSDLVKGIEVGKTNTGF